MINFSKDLQTKVEILKTEMKTDCLEIPDSDGLILVKAGSDEHKKRIKMPFIMLFPIKEKDGTCKFLISTI